MEAVRGASPRFPSKGPISNSKVMTNGQLHYYIQLWKHLWG